MSRKIEIMFSERYYVKDNTIEQHFSFNKRNKDKRFFLQHFFLLYDRFEKKLIEKLLTIPGKIEFSYRLDLEDKIVLVYTKIGGVDTSFLKNKHFVMTDIVPDYRGCSFCIHKVETDSIFFYCDKKDKNFTNDVKTCKFFKQKNMLGN